MLAKLKELLGATAAPSKVNLERRFTILAETSQGSMSKVFRAIDNKTGRNICLKVHIPEKNDAAAARACREDRPSEGEITAAVVHPNVSKVLDFGLSTNREHFLVMEYVDGFSLQYIRENKSLPKLRHKLEILAQTAEALSAVHAAGFIHHDINPGNILVDRDKHVTLIDFGLAVPNTPAFRKPGNRTGALKYMAPELIRREPIDEGIDIFAFGVLAYEFLTDKLPYDASSSMASMLGRINQDPIDPYKANPNLPPPLIDLLRSLIARRKTDRCKSLSQVPAALRAIAPKILATPPATDRA